MEDKKDTEIVHSNGAIKGGIELDAMETLLDVPSRQHIEETVILNRRGKGKMKFKVRAIGGEEYKDIQEQCTQRVRNRRGGGMTTEFDARKSQRLVVLACVLEPSLKDKKLMEAYNVPADQPELVVDRALLPGEVDLLSESILDLSGYTDEVLEKVKV